MNDTTRRGIRATEVLMISTLGVFLCACMPDMTGTLEEHVPLLADPDWGTKIAAGKACDIRRCISCRWRIESLQ